MLSARSCLSSRNFWTLLALRLHLPVPAWLSEGGAGARGRLRESRGPDCPWTRVFYLNGWRGRRTLPFNMYSKGALRGSQQITPASGEPPHPTPHFAGHQRVPRPLGRPWQFSTPGGPKTNHCASLTVFEVVGGERLSATAAGCSAGERPASGHTLRGAVRPRWLPGTAGWEGEGRRRPALGAGLACSDPRGT